MIDGIAGGFAVQWMMPSSVPQSAGSWSSPSVHVGFTTFDVGSAIVLGSQPAATKLIRQTASEERCMSLPFVRHESEAPTVPCPCGFSTRIVSAADGTPCSFHVTQIHDAERHWHERTSEVYYILEGTGKVELDGAWHEVRPGSVVNIPAGTRHRIVSEAGLKTVVVAMPAFDVSDEFVE
jgi:mannose-6-phosphate isomerase-like protein (cupin superfamily)